MPSRPATRPRPLLLLGGAASVALALGALFTARSPDATNSDASPLDERCDLVAPGDSRAEAMGVIGLEGYRPGCGASLPCLVEVLPDGQRFPYSCEGEDCALLWVDGALRCHIDTGPDGIVRAVDLRTLPGP